MKHSIRHDLAPEMAKKVAERALAAYTERFPEFAPTTRWSSSERAEISFSAKGMSLAGALTLKAKEIAIELDVPFVFKMFEKKAVALIEDEVKAWLARAKNGEI